METHTATQETNQNMTAIDVLRLFAWINLILPSAVGIHMLMNSVMNPIALAIGGAFIMEGVFGCAFLHVVAGMAEDMKAIRKQTEHQQ